MQTNNQEETTFNKSSRRGMFRKVLYFGIPILVATSSAVFPIRPFLRQAMVGFTLIWFVAGSWLFPSPK